MEAAFLFDPVSKEITDRSNALVVMDQ